MLLDTGDGQGIAGGREGARSKGERERERKREREVGRERRDSGEKHVRKDKERKHVTTN